MVVFSAVGDDFVAVHEEHAHVEIDVGGCFRFGDGLVVRRAFALDEIVDVDAGIVLEDKPKEIMSTRDLHKTLGRKLALKITMYTDTKPREFSKWTEHGSELGDFPEIGDYPMDHGGGLGSS